MSSDHLHNQMQQVAQRVVNTIAHPRFATVTSVNPNDHSVKVTIEPEGIQTGWIPAMSSAIGNGWGVSHLHAVGDQVVFVPMENSPDHGVVLGGLYSNSQQPPKSPATPNADPTVAPSGELLMRHSSGTFLRFCSDGSIISSGAIWHHKGDFHVDGDVYDKHGSLDRLRSNYDAHTHGGVQSGGASTSAPNTHQDSE